MTAICDLMSFNEDRNSSICSRNSNFLRFLLETWSHLICGHVYVASADVANLDVATNIAKLNTAVGLVLVTHKMSLRLIESCCDKCFPDTSPMACLPRVPAADN